MAAQAAVAQVKEQEKKDDRAAESQVTGSLTELSTAFEKAAQQNGMQVDDFRTRLNCALRVIQREEVNEELKAEDPPLEEWEQDAARWVRVDDYELTATEAVIEKT